MIFDQRIGETFVALGKESGCAGDSYRLAFSPSLGHTAPALLSSGDWRSHSGKDECNAGGIRNASGFVDICGARRLLKWLRPKLDTQRRERARGR
jgi:hypothetical protein